MTATTAATAVRTDQVTALVLGPTAARVGGRPVDLGGPRQRRLLAALAVDAGAVVPADRLAERVWGDGGLPDDPRRTLRTYLTRLRAALGGSEVITTEPAGWQLDPSAVTVDARRFDELVAAADDPGLDVHERLGRLDAALALWRGRAYEEVADEEWARAEADRLEELRVTVIERRYEAMLATGMHTDALPGLVAEVEAHPFRDRLVGLEMLALFRSGRQAEATRVFQAHRARLAEELGLEPGAELVELDRRIVAGDPSLQPTVVAGRALRGYRLGEQLGEGAFAVVYRGTQPALGRDVAVKIIRSELANRPEFVRRFEAEAHLVARLEHPHIVPLYDYWREPDRAFLVFRYLRAGNLEGRLTAEGGLRPEEASRLVTQVGSALAAAHAAGVVHRDVKPANVFVDEAGNFYLGDFGIALEAAETSDSSAALSVGSPAYASPEQLRREPVGPPADVHGLGISVYEALTARLPFPDAASQAELLARQLNDPLPPVRDLRPDVPVAVDAVLARATAKDPTERYQAVGEFVTDLVTALGGQAATGRRGATTVLPGEAHNPYKGLRAFTEADAADFYGRERLVDRLIEALARSGTSGRIAAVVGPSGIGKSSVVRAGLLPALRRGAVPGSNRWFVATMLPGTDPFDELAAALVRVATHVPDNVMGLLTDDHRGIARVVKAVVPDDGTEVLLVIDQFEEVFTLVDDDSRRRRFLAALEHAVTDARCPLRVVLTMRADFWDRPLRHGAFARLIEHSTVAVTALAPDELERAIVEPAHCTGCEFEPGLVSEIVADVADQPGALPLLQYALTELWDRQVSGLLTRDAYRDLGGVAGALTRRAEDLYRAASDAEQAATRPLFERLVTLGEGTEDTRRRALVSELGTDSAATSVVDRYGQARLLSFDHDPASREPTVEVAHEALIRQWPRLRDWLDEDRDGLRLHRHLAAAARDWDGDGRPAAELYRGGRLDAAADWAAANPGRLTSLQQAFLDAGITRRDAEAVAERQRVRRLRRLVTGVAIFAILALVAGLLALTQWSRADEQAAEAREQADVAAANEALALEQTQVAEDNAADAAGARFDADIRRMANQAGVLADEDPALAMLVAATAHQEQPGIETLGGLQRALTRADGLLGFLHGGPGYSHVRFTADDRLVARTGTGLEVWDIGERRLLHDVDLGGPGLLAVLAGGGQALASVAGGTLHLVDLDTGAIAVSTDPGPEITALAAGHDSAVAAVARGEAIDLLFGTSLARESTIDNPARVDQLLFGPDDTTLITADSFSIVRSYDVGVGEPRWAATSDGPLEVAGITPSFTSENNNPIGLLRLDRTGRQVIVPQLVGTFLLDVASGDPVGAWAAPQGSIILHAADLGDARALMGESVIDVDTGEIVGDLRIGGTGAGVGDISPDGSRVALASTDEIRLWSLDGAQLLARAVLANGANQAYLDPVGRRLAANDWPLGGSSIWDLETTEAIDPALTDDTWMVAWMPSGGFMSYESSGETRSWDPDTFAPNGVGVEPLNWGGYATDPEDRLAAVGATVPPGSIRIYEIESAALVERLDDLAQEADRLGQSATSLRTVSQFTFSPDGSTMLGITAQGLAGVFDTGTWELQEFLELGDPVANAAFSSDGRVLAVQVSDGSVHLIDPVSLEPADDPLPVQGARRGVITDHHLAFGPEDRTLVVGLPGGGQVWDLESRERIGGEFPNEGLFAASPAFDGRYVVTSVGGHLLVWDLDTDRWVDVACQAAGRNLTTEEWQQYGPAGAPYRATCEQWPAVA